VGLGGSEIGGVTGDEVGGEVKGDTTGGSEIGDATGDGLGAEVTGDAVGGLVSSSSSPLVGLGEGNATGDLVGAEVTGDTTGDGVVGDTFDGLFVGTDPPSSVNPNLSISQHTLSSSGMG